MGVRYRLISDVIRHVIDDPSSLRRYASKRGLRRLGYFIRMVFAPHHGSWQRRPGNVAVREYRDYQDYIDHQTSKLGLFDFRSIDESLDFAIARRTQDMDLQAKSVLCLAARLGGEVRGFRRNGAFAVGVDLNPGLQNQHVLHGDFHDLSFADGSAHVVFSNSLDHSLDIRRLLAEVRRVLAPGGTFIVEATAGAEEFDDWAATTWSSVDELGELIEGEGFLLKSREDISVPWEGEHLRFVDTTGFADER